MSAKTRRKYSLGEKMHILAQFDSKTGTRAALATQLGIPLSTLTSIVKNREKVELQYTEQQQQHEIVEKSQTHLSGGELEAAPTETVSSLTHLKIKTEPVFEDPGAQSEAVTPHEMYDRQVEDLNFDFQALKMKPVVKTEQAADTEEFEHVGKLRVKAEPDPIKDAVIQSEESYIERGDRYGQTQKRDNAGGGQPGCKPCFRVDTSDPQYHLMKRPVESAAQMKGSNTSGLKIQFMEPMLINAHVATRLRVSNVDHKVDEKKLKEVFSLAGTVVSVQLIQDKNCRNPGFGMVQFSNPLEAIQAISMLHNQILYDCKLAVCIDEGEGSVAGPPKRLPEGLGGLGSDLGMRSAPLSDVTNSIGYRLVNPGFMSRPPQMTATQEPKIAGERNTTVSPSNAVNASAPHGQHLSLNGGIDGRGPVTALGDVGCRHRQRTASRFGTGSEGLVDGSSSGAVSENSSYIRNCRVDSNIGGRTGSRFGNSSRGQVGGNICRAVSEQNSHIRHYGDDGRVGDRTALTFRNNNRVLVGGNSSRAFSEYNSHIRHFRDNSRFGNRTASRYGYSSNGQVGGNSSRTVAEHNSYIRYPRYNNYVGDRTTSRLGNSNMGLVGINSFRAVFERNSYVRNFGNRTARGFGNLCWKQN